MGCCNNVFQSFSMLFPTFCGEEGERGVALGFGSNFIKAMYKERRMCRGWGSIWR